MSKIFDMWLVRAIAAGFVFGLVLGHGQSQAADLKPLPVPFKSAPLASSPGCQWCGLYFGASAGYGGADFIANFDGSRDLTSLSAKHSANSILCGAHLGYNYQFGPIAIGAETYISITALQSNPNTAQTTLSWP